MRKDILGVYEKLIVLKGVLVSSEQGSYLNYVSSIMQNLVRFRRRGEDAVLDLPDFGGGCLM